MREDEPLSQELNEFERRLRSLSPAPSRVDRDLLMFELGSHRGRRRGQRWVWPSAAAAMVLVAFAAGHRLGSQSVLDPPAIAKSLTPAEPAPEKKAAAPDQAIEVSPGDFAGAESIFPPSSRASSLSLADHRFRNRAFAEPSTPSSSEILTAPAPPRWRDRVEWVDRLSKGLDI